MFRKMFNSLCVVVGSNHHRIIVLATFTARMPLNYIVVVMAVVVCQCHAQPNNVARHYCGRNIGLALELICYSQDMIMEKRSGNRDLAMYGNNLAPSFWNEPDAVEEGWPWLAPHKARSTSVARNKRYIVDECCRKPCTQSELINYCD